MILYIAKRSSRDIGTVMHLKAVKELYGKENVFVIDLLNKEAIERKQYISFGYNGRNGINRCIRYLQGNINFITDGIIKRLCKLIKEYNINMIFSEESDLGKLYKIIKQKFPNVKIVVFFHDISAELFKMRIKDAPKWKIHYLLECRRVISQENVCQKYSDQKWVYHRSDAQRFYNVYGYYPDEMVPLVSDLAEYRSNCKAVVSKPEDEKILLFVCSSYYVNKEGFMWFYSSVVDKLDRRYRIRVVGEGTNQLKGIVDNDRIELIGRVDKMEPYYERADIVIAPVFDGGGMKVKTIEALAFGKCFVSTSESLNGYWEKIPDSVRNRLVFKCDTSDQWIEACNKLLNEEVKKCNEEILDVMRDSFSYETLLDKFRKKLPIR